MAGQGRRNADEVLALAIACGSTIEGAAAKIGLALCTVRRRLKKPAFQKRVRDIRAEMVQRTTAMLTAAAGEAVKTLLDLQKNCTTASVRLNAARTILELGVKLRENAELAERIAALEQQFGIEAAPPPIAPPPEAPPPTSTPPAPPPATGPPMAQAA